MHILRGVTRTAVIDLLQAPRPRDRGAALHGRGGPRRHAEAFITAASNAGHAGGADRRPPRSATASPARWRSRCAPRFHDVAESHARDSWYVAPTG